MPLVLTDTAGLRAHADTDDPIERMGIDRTRRAVAEADLVMTVFDGSELLVQADLDVISAVQGANPRSQIAVINKSDLPQRIDLTRLADALAGTQTVEASATEPGGMDRLEEALAGLVLAGKVVRGSGAGDEATITNLRHLDALQRAQDHVTAALSSADAQMPATFIAVDLHSALNILGEITGETASEDLLDEIFRNFCIGK